MFLYFEDWSAQRYILPAKGLPASERLIKVFTSLRDPREYIRKPDLVRLAANTDRFQEQEIYSYPGRDGYEGGQLEATLQNGDHADLPFSDEGRSRFRALFRFANQPDIRTCQRAMAVTTSDGQWRKQHPFEIVDYHKPQDKIVFNQTLHVDIFHADSVNELRSYVDIDNPNAMATPREGFHLRSIEAALSMQSEEVPLIRRERL